MNILIPMAGSGQRFLDYGYTVPKFLINIFGKPMISHAIKSLGLNGNYIYVVQKKDYDGYNLKKILSSITPNCEIVVVENKTEGAASTTLFAEKLINNETPLIIVNSDQIIEWDLDVFKHLISTDIDGAIATFKASGNKWSYVKINNLGLIDEVAEKKEISNDATAGLYYWSKGLDYVESAKQMIQKNIRVNNEFYVAPVYNEAILKGKKIKPFELIKMYSVGTPEDLKEYIEANNEI